MKNFPKNWKWRNTQDEDGKEWKANKVFSLERHIKKFQNNVFIVIIGLRFRNILPIVCVYFIFTCIYYDYKFQDNLRSLFLSLALLSKYLLVYYTSVTAFGIQRLLDYKYAEFPEFPWTSLESNKDRHHPHPPTPFFFQKNWST